MRALLVFATILGSATPAPDAREEAYRHNNRGVGLLEQFQPASAVDEFRQALRLEPELNLARVNLAIALLSVPDLPAAEREARAAVEADPASPHAHYVLALAARAQGDSGQALASFRRVAELDPADVGAMVNLGQLLLQDRQFPESIRLLRAASEAEPHNATAAYNLGLALTRGGQAEEGRMALARFQALKDSGYATSLGQAYGEQGRYAEAIPSRGAEAGLVDEATPAALFRPLAAPALARGVGAGRVTLFDLDRDGDLDLLAVGPAGQRLFRNRAGAFTDVTRALGLDPKAAGLGAVAGDVDKDGRADLVVLRETGVTLHRGVAGRGFRDATPGSGLPVSGSSRTAALADVDHDGDLDLVLPGWDAPLRLFQNAGDATFKDVTAASGAAGPAGRSIAVLATDYDNGRDVDLLDLRAGAAPRLLRNRRDGTFQDVAAEAGLARASAWISLAAADVNKDGFTDLFLGAPGGDQLALSDGRGRLALQPAPGGSTGATAALFLDYDNDGLLDLVASSPAGTRLLRNLGARWDDVTEAALAGEKAIGAVSLAAGDLDGDGDTDLVAVTAAGAIRAWRNEGGRNRSARVRLEGLVSNRSGIGVKVEARAGSLRQKLETTASTPATGPADVVFGLGRRGAPEVVRILWPSGILQAELAPSRVAAAGRGAFAYAVKELDRKPSSCPYLYAWDGRGFAFVTDFLGGGEMGYLMAPGVWNVPDPLEHVRLTDEQLRPREGRYELRVTNELEEALFLDRLALVAVAHPADVEVHPAEGMTVPPRPFRLFAVKDARPPSAATDDRGRNVLDRVRTMDRRYALEYERPRIRGYAEMRTLTLDLGAVPDRAALLLTGWTDYAFSSDNRAASQAGLALHPPSLEVEDADGRWVTAIGQVGIPVGRPQTVVADLSGIWKGPRRRVRLRTSMRVLWDQIRVGALVDVPTTSVTVEAARADLSERGFSAEVSPDGGEPYGYDYTRVSMASPWKAIPGRYTRTGDVRELLAAADDVFVVSRPGDEVALSFDAAAAGDLPAGWRRTFLLLADGYSKEMDINSATPDALGPFPFHAMSRYPYAAPEAYPMTEARRERIERYNTRVVRDPLPGLDAALAAYRLPPGSSPE